MRNAEVAAVVAAGIVLLAPARAEAHFVLQAPPSRAANAAEVLRRIALPRTSPEIMPRRRAGELPAWARARIADFLAPPAR